MLRDECESIIENTLKMYSFEQNDELTRNEIKNHIEKYFSKIETIFSCKANVTDLDEKLRTEVEIITMDVRYFKFDIIL